MGSGFLAFRSNDLTMRGGIQAFDLNRRTGEVAFVGAYRVQAGARANSLSSVVALEWDRSSGRLLVWHGWTKSNVMSVVDLSSRDVGNEEFRIFEGVRTYSGPSDRQHEGLAVIPTSDGDGRGRTLDLTVDDSKKHALLCYDRFTPRCEVRAATRAERGGEGAQPTRSLAQPARTRASARQARIPHQDWRPTAPPIPFAHDERRRTEHGPARENARPRAGC